MQKLVNQIYVGKKIDKFKPVTRFEYEQRDIRQRLDMADVYTEIMNIQKALQTIGLEVETEKTQKEHENYIIELVKEDRLDVKQELLELDYYNRLDNYNKGSLKEKIRVKLFGLPDFPNQELDDLKKNKKNKNKDKLSKKKEYLEEIYNKQEKPIYKTQENDVVTKEKELYTDNESQQEAQIKELFKIINGENLSVEG